MIGVLDYPSGRVAWDIRPCDAARERPPATAPAQGAASPPAQALQPRAHRRRVARGPGRRRSSWSRRSPSTRWARTCATGELKEIRLGQNTRIYDKNGKLLGIIAGRDQPHRRPAAGGSRRSLKDATVAIEDKRFYEHHGVDYYRLLGAALRDLESGSATQGGSTITMQLVKNLYDPQRRPDALARRSRRRTSPTSTRRSTRRTRSWRST